MAWVSRTSRDNNKVGAPASATANIGPGSYTFTAEGERTRPSYAPFGSTDVRKFVAGSFVTPGPGSYTKPMDANEGFGSSKGASVAFLSQTQRDQPASKFTTPGPGSYIKRSDIAKAKTIKR